jgi:hypothetical protein
MTLLEFFKRFLWHVVTAGVCVLCLLGIVEFLAPGSVLPFFDLVDFGFLLFILAGVGVMVWSRE